MSTAAQASEEPVSFTKYERARMIGSRALQISMGAPFLVKLTEEDLQRVNFDPIEIALQEFRAGVLPITVRRPMVKVRGR